MGTKLINNVSRVQADKIRVLVYNKFFVKLYYVTTTIHDTTYCYGLYTECKLSIKKRENIVNYINGIIDCLQSL